MTDLNDPCMCCFPTGNLNSCTMGAETRVASHFEEVLVISGRLNGTQISHHVYLYFVVLLVDFYPSSSCKLPFPEHFYKMYFIFYKRIQGSLPVFACNHIFIRKLHESECQALINIQGLVHDSLTF